MKKRKSSSGPRRPKYQPPIALERLSAMHDALYAVADKDEKLSTAMLAEIAQALSILGAMIEAELRARKRGPPQARVTLDDAELVRYLVNEHGATPKEALAAALPRTTARHWERVERKYRRIKATIPADVSLVVQPQRESEAVERLVRSRQSRSGQK
jgi:hypothetical protein